MDASGGEHGARAEQPARVGDVGRGPSTGGAVSGAPRDPFGATTVRRRRIAPRGARVAGWIAVPFALAGAVVLLWSAAAPQPLFGPSLVAGGLIVLAGIAWIVALVFAIVGRTLAVGVLLAPALVAVAMVLVAADVPFRVGFELARPSLEAAVAAGTCPERAGLFTVSDCVLEDDFSYFEIEDAGFLNGVGYGFVPPGAAAPTVGTTLFAGPVVMAPIADGWYVAVEPW